MGTWKIKIIVEENIKLNSKNRSEKIQFCNTFSSKKNEIKVLTDEKKVVIK